jgi:S1 RNA binding domain protein
MKKAADPAPRPTGDRNSAQSKSRNAPSKSQGYAPKPQGYKPKAAPAPANMSFEDKLKQFMQDSDSRISGSRMYSDKKSGYRRRRD